MSGCKCGAPWYGHPVCFDDERCLGVRRMSQPATGLTYRVGGDGQVRVSRGADSSVRAAFWSGVAWGAFVGGVVAALVSLMALS